ncbi:hypothetical protein [Streptomyces sp. NTH33]|uniref:hypothetical protein n=1 Tax=Streptomyces sp. NTH33 TaxID=1735453 RepID=UPI0011B93726|nr:hypothetical protein [Streptomyces sp. NTH33]
MSRLRPLLRTEARRKLVVDEADQEAEDLPGLNLDRAGRGGQAKVLHLVAVLLQAGECLLLDRGGRLCQYLGHRDTGIHQSLQHTFMPTQPEPNDHVRNADGF